MKQSVAQHILNEVKRRGSGYVFTPTDFLYLGSRAAIDQGLSRLVKSGHLSRLARGVYTYPETHPLVGQVPPAPMVVAQALARAQGAATQVSEAAAANALGLTTQVPGRVVCWTNGTPRTRRIGNTVIQFKRATPRRLLGAGTPAGTVVQALRYVGPEGVNEQLVERVQRALPRKERRELRRLLRLTPGWMQPTIKRITTEQPRG